MARVVNSVTRSKNMPTVDRAKVSPGSLFQLVQRNGSLGKKVYLALGHNGKLFSINIHNGELASSKNGAKKVTIVGKGTIQTSMLPAADQSKKRRNQVRGDEIFRAAGEGREKSYLHLGRLTNGKFTSVDVSKPFGEDYAVTDNGDRNVVVVGKWSIDVQLAA